MARPRILITRAEAIPGERWDDYGDRVHDAGGDPLAADLASWTAGHATSPHDGLLLTAGVDIDPAHYGERRSERVQEVNPYRDAFEIPLLESALERDIPVFGICRGHQLFNVGHGGSLLQHLEQREPHRARRGADGESIDSGWHDVQIVPGTLLARAIDEQAAGTTVRTNSRHHQAVTPERLGRGLVVAATAPGGVVEALVDPGQCWALSVQWHPEMEEAAAPFRPLFEAFVRACAEVAAEASGRA